MRTTVTLDDELLNQAQQLSGFLLSALAGPAGARSTSADPG
jgi:DNA mismatch repair protein MutH